MREIMYEGYRIITDDTEGEYEYEISVEGYRRGDWHSFHMADGFKSEEDAIAAAKKYLDNYDGPGDDYYAQ